MQVTGINLQEQTANDLPQAATAKTALPDQPATATVTPTAKANPEKDTVELSTGAQVQLLSQQGNSVSEIATRLKLDVKTVESYLQSANSNTTNFQQTYSPALQTTAATQPNDNTGKNLALAQAGPQNDQVKTVAQNSSEPSSYAKTINRFSGLVSTVATQMPKV